MLCLFHIFFCTFSLIAHFCLSFGFSVSHVQHSIHFFSCPFLLTLILSSFSFSHILLSESLSLSLHHTPHPFFKAKFSVFMRERENKSWRVFISFNNPQMSLIDTSKLILFQSVQNRNHKLRKLFFQTFIF